MPLFGRLDASIVKITGETRPHRVAGLRFFYFDGLFASFSDNLVAGFLELFLLSYGVSNSIIGLNTSIANLCAALSIVPGALAISRARSRKRLVVATGGGIARIGLLAISAVPLLAGEGVVAVASLVGLNAIRTVMGNFCNPAWTSMVADLVPEGARARYFGKRNVAMIAASIAAAPLAGAVVKSLSGVAGLPHLGYQAIFFLSFAVGMLSTASFASIPDDAVSESSAPKPAGFPLKALLSDRRFAGFAASAFVWNTSLQVTVPFFNVYLVSHMGATAATVGILTGISLFSTLFGQLLFGRITDRKGNTFVLVLTGLVIPILPLSWVVMTRPGQVAVLNVLSGAVWAGYNLANFNILLKITPDDHRPEATALYQTLVAASSVFGPLIGGAMADRLGFASIFVASGAGRFVGILLFIFLVLGPGPLADRLREREAPRARPRPRP